ncbi:MAG: thioesterase family protein [Flavobacteriales bacterium]|nr:thioesterase family protein [Flavobacteriales bacterium]
MIKELKNTSTFRVRFSEVDSLRIVWHGHYLKYFEDGRDAWGAQYGLDFLLVYERYKLLAPLVKTNLDFKYPLRYNEIGLIETTFVNAQAAKVIFRYKIFDEHRKQLKVEGETVQVFMDMDNVLQLNTPAFFEEWKRKHGLI